MFCWTKNTPKPDFLNKTEKNHPKCKNSKMSRNMPKLVIRPLNRGLQNIGKRSFHHIQTKIFKSETTSFHYFSPKDSESLHILDIRLQEVGAKRHLNGTPKVNKDTDTLTHRRTNQLRESIGPEGWCFENIIGWIIEVFFLLAMDSHNS